MRFMRESVHGGVSECRSPADKVGYGRCHHILGDSSKEITIKYSKDDRCHYVNVSDGSSTKRVEAQERDIVKFLDSLRNNNISEEKAFEIIKKLK